MNIAKLANAAIAQINRDIDLRYFRNMGIVANEDGDAVLTYAPPKRIMAQVQQPSPSKNVQAQEITENTTTRKVWLFNWRDAENHPRGFWRPLSRSGDYLQFPDDTFWLITSSEEDYQAEGWQSVVCTLTIEPPTELLEAANA